MLSFKQTINNCQTFILTGIPGMPEKDFWLALSLCLLYSFTFLGDEQYQANSQLKQVNETPEGIGIRKGNQRRNPKTTFYKSKDPSRKSNCKTKHIYLYISLIE